MIIARYDVILDQSERAHLYNHLSNYAKTKYNVYNISPVPRHFVLSGFDYKAEICYAVTLYVVFVHHLLHPTRISPLKLDSLLRKQQETTETFKKPFLSIFLLSSKNNTDNVGSQDSQDRNHGYGHKQIHILFIYPFFILSAV